MNVISNIIKILKWNYLFIYNPLESCELAPVQAAGQGHLLTVVELLYESWLHLELGEGSKPYLIRKPLRWDTDCWCKIDPRVIPKGVLGPTKWTYPKDQELFWKLILRPLNKKIITSTWEKLKIFWKISLFGGPRAP